MKLDQVTDAELSILQFLWERGQATTRQITDALYEEATDPKIATVQKLTERLESKGAVERDRSERAHRFLPLISHEEFLHSRLQTLADRLCDGALTPLVTTLLKSKGISSGQRRQLRELADDLWPSDDTDTPTSN